jgi:hypothetical protein
MAAPVIQPQRENQSRPHLASPIGMGEGSSKRCPEIRSGHFRLIRGPVSKPNFRSALVRLSRQLANDFRHRSEDRAMANLRVYRDNLAQILCCELKRWNLPPALPKLNGLRGFVDTRAGWEGASRSP